MTGTDGPTIRLLTLTRFWLFQRRLHNVGDASLWVPVQHRTIIWTTAVFVPAWFLMSLLHLGWSGPGLTGHVVAPFLLTWWIVSQAEQGVRPWDVVTSWTGHVWAMRPDRPTATRLRSRTRVVA